jgi:ribosomal protein S18 acetylase RimI-like enzyme
LPIPITPAESPADFTAFAGLVSAYVDWCRERYREDTWFVDKILGHQSLASELKDLPVKYSLPNGRAFLARQNGVICGCGAYRWIGDGIVEMKRVFVPAAFSARGLGRAICETMMQSAREDGATLMRLDTAHLFHEAIALYEKLGFTRCPPYNEYPKELKPYIVFMERPI